MLIGHNPGMHELALMLAGSGDAAAKKSLGDNLPTAGLAILDFAIADWNEVAFRRGNLGPSPSPKLRRRARDDGGRRTSLPRHAKLLTIRFSSELRTSSP